VLIQAPLEPDETIGRGFGLVTVVLQHLDEVATERGIVVDDQEAHAGLKQRRCHRGNVQRRDVARRPRDRFAPATAALPWKALNFSGLAVRSDAATAGAKSLRTIELRAEARRQVKPSGDSGVATRQADWTPEAQ
jgi:hypothetical protein